MSLTRRRHGLQPTPVDSSCPQQPQCHTSSRNEGLMWQPGARPRHRRAVHGPMTDHGWIPDRVDGCAAKSSKINACRGQTAWRGGEKAMTPTGRRLAWEETGIERNSIPSVMTKKPSRRTNLTEFSTTIKHARSRMHRAGNTQPYCRNREMYIICSAGGNYK